MWPTPKSSPSGPDYARSTRDGSGGDDLATAAARELVSDACRIRLQGLVGARPATTATRGAHPLEDTDGGTVVIRRRRRRRAPGADLGRRGRRARAARRREPQSDVGRMADGVSRSAGRNYEPDEPRFGDDVGDLGAALEERPRRERSSRQALLAPLARLRSGSGHQAESLFSSRRANAPSGSRTIRAPTSRWTDWTRGAARSSATKAQA